MAFVLYIYLSICILIETVFLSGINMDQTLWPAGVLHIWAELGRKASSPVQQHPAPGWVGPELSLGPVRPGVRRARSLIPSGAVPAGAVGAPVLHLPWIRSVTTRHQLLHGGSDLAGVPPHPQLTNTSVSHQLRISICNKTCWATHYRLKRWASLKFTFCCLKSYNQSSFHSLEFNLANRAQS